MLLRWLLPVVAMFALLGSAVTSWASAGLVGESSCCCPQPAKCKCHDHDGKTKPLTMKRCGGEAERVAPAAMVGVPTIEPAIVDEPRTVAVVSIDPITIPDDITYAPETPPF